MGQTLTPILQSLESKTSPLKIQQNYTKSLKKKKKILRNPITLDRKKLYSLI